MTHRVVALLHGVVLLWTTQTYWLGADRAAIVCKVEQLLISRLFLRRGCRYSVGTPMDRLDHLRHPWPHESRSNASRAPGRRYQRL